MTEYISAVSEFITGAPFGVSVTYMILFSTSVSVPSLTVQVTVYCPAVCGAVQTSDEEVPVIDPPSQVHS